MTRALPFTIIGGYLGAGKTTLLNHLLTGAEGLRLAVLVNDFGSVNIDASLIRSHDGETIELANGCMCCTLVGGFAAAIGQVLDRADRFDHLVIEASGVADPAKIAQYGQMYGLPLDGILLVVDAEQIRTQLANKYVGDTVLRQFEQADVIILNKTDLVSPENATSLQRWFGVLSPGAPVVETVQSRVATDVLLGVRGDRRVDTVPDSPFTDHSHGYGTWTIEHARPVSRDALDRFASGVSTDVYRAKGFVYLQDDPDRRYVYQQVGRRWSVEPAGEWGDAARLTRLVAIGLAGATSAEALQALL